MFGLGARKERMNWSFRIAQVAGIEIKVHITFFLILIYGAIQWGGASNPQGALFGVVVMILLFTCVVLHELGHSLVALYYDIPVRQIVLLPLGGVAQLGRLPEQPLQELLIAVAGPMVNVVIALVLIFVTGVGLALNLLDQSVFSQQGEMLQPSLTTLLFVLIAANVSLVFFNLIPAFPMDGGRILRAILAYFIEYSLATRIATFIGQGLSFVLGLLGVLSGNIVLVLVAVFVFFGADQERTETQVRTVLRTLRVGDAYNKHALTLAVGDRASKVTDYILTSYQPDFAVMQGRTLLGVITRDEMLQALTSYDRDPYVTEIMRREVLRVDAGDSLHEVRQALAERPTRVAAVYEGTQFLGLISIEDIAEALIIVAFEQQRVQARRAQPARS
jgi:Zn-dependent protease